MPTFVETFRFAVELAILYSIFYFLLRFMEGTRGAGILKGLLAFWIFVNIVLTGVAWLLESDRLKELQGFFATFAVFAALIIFQPELRRALMQVGQTATWWGGFFGERSKTIDEIVKAVSRMSNTRTGALIALERSIGLGILIESGVVLDSVVSSSMLTTIFHRGSPLHDGGVVIQGDRIAAAACRFPLSENPNLPAELGMRHRAAVGATEESDAMCIVVSEETGKIALATRGQILMDFSLDRLRDLLAEMYTRPAPENR